MILEVRGVRKHLGGRWVLRGVELEWDRPGVLAVCGANGAGKSTLLRVLAGVLAPDGGDVRVCGSSVVTARTRALRQVGYLPEAAEMPAHLTVCELVALVATLRGGAAPEAHWVDDLGVRPLWHERYVALSLGQRRRVGLLTTLAGDPALLALDEPTNGLDAAGCAALAGWLRARAAAGRAAVITTHDPGLIAGCADARVDLVDGVAVWPAG